MLFPWYYLSRVLFVTPETHEETQVVLFSFGGGGWALQDYFLRVTHFTTREHLNVSLCDVIKFKC